MDDLFSLVFVMLLLCQNGIYQQQQQRGIELSLGLGLQMVKLFTDICGYRYLTI